MVHKRRIVQSEILRGYRESCLLVEFANGRHGGWFIRFEVAGREAPCAHGRWSGSLDQKNTIAIVDHEHSGTRFGTSVDRVLTVGTVPACSSLDLSVDDSRATSRAVGGVFAHRIRVGRSGVIYRSAIVLMKNAENSVCNPRTIAVNASISHITNGSWVNPLAAHLLSR